MLEWVRKGPTVPATELSLNETINSSSTAAGGKAGCVGTDGADGYI